ncbi:MAG: hypothetical protein AMXMBFR64_31820 [Myxococcales bacterium]
MLQKTYTVLLALAAAFVAARAWFRIVGPEAAYYATTAGLLVAIIVGVVLVFVVVSHLAIRLFGWMFQGALRRSYILFLGWNLLRSHRSVVLLSAQLGGVLHDVLPRTRLLRTSLLSLPAAAALIVGAWVVARQADPAHAIPAAFVELFALAMALGGGLLGLRGLLGLAVRAKWLRPLDVTDPNARLPMHMRSGVTVPNFISMVGVGIGVWALIMVLSVMSGFEADLRDKILATNAHVIVQPKDHTGVIDDYAATADRIAALDGVDAAWPFAEGEVMISSPFNTSVNLTVRGLTQEGAAGLDLHMDSGDVAWLERPELLLSDASWELTRRRKAAPQPEPAFDGAIELPPIPGGAPGGAPEEPSDGITMPPIPGAAEPATQGDRLPGLLITQAQARDLQAVVGDVVLAMRRTGDDGAPSAGVTVEALQVLGVYRKGREDADRPDGYVLPAALRRLRQDGQRALVMLSADGDREVPAFLAPFDPALPDVAALSQELVAGSLEALADRGVPDRAGPSPSPLPFMGAAAARVHPAVLLGRELAGSLRVEVGHEVRLISPDGEVGPTGVRPKASTFVVAGIFSTGMYEFDLKLAYVQLADAQRFFNMGASLNRIEVRVADPTLTSEVVERITAVVPPDLEALDWKVMNRNLFSALKLEKIAMFFILGFIILVASFNILASLAMLIQEKSSEIAILKSMGATNQGVMRSFLVLGLFLGVIGAFCGIGMGLGLCLVLEVVGIPLPKEYYIEMIPVQVNWLEVLAAAAAALGICLLATIYPSRTASRLHPVEGLRYE